MSERNLSKRILDLLQERERIEEQISNLQVQLVKKLCPKGKEQCDPAYCTLRITNTCPFIKEWSKILDDAKIPQESKYDLFIEFIDKVSKHYKIQQ